MHYLYTEHRVWFPVTLAIIAVAALVLLAPVPQFKPHGIVLPTQLQRAPLKADQVVVYTVPPPINYQIVGLIRIELFYNRNDPHVKAELYNYAKKLTANVGGNGFFIDNIFPAQLSSEAKGQVIYNVRAIAIYLPERPFDFDRNAAL